MRSVFLCAVIALVAVPSMAVNVVIDYTYDSAGFFNTGTTDGAHARAAMDEVATFFSTLLEDSLPAIETPAEFRSESLAGVRTWNWEATFSNPSTGQQISVDNPTIAADEYRIYAGARSIPGTTVGFGGPGGWNQSFSGIDNFTSEEQAQVDAITTSFQSAIATRGQDVGDFATWGGAVTFDNDGSTEWHFDPAAEPGPGLNDFLSVAFHEVGHVLGLGTTDQWNALASSGSFVGSAAIEANGGTAPALDPSRNHWVNGTTSTIFGTYTPQEAALDPTILRGSRKRFTALDMAALADLGWEVADDGLLPGDYNIDGTVDAADYTVWRDSLDDANPIGSYDVWADNYGLTGGGSAISVPEPASMVGVLLALVSGCVARRVG